MTPDPTPSTETRTEGNADRVLVVMRHSKSSWHTGAPDHERPLSARGQRDALAAGAWLAERGIEPERAVVSTSLRTRQTVDHVAAGGAGLGAIDFDRAVYETDEQGLLELVRATDDSVRTLLLIGHNPTLEDLIRLLARRVGNHKWWAALDLKFPTSAIAVIGFDGAWTDVEPGVGALLAYQVPAVSAHRTARPRGPDPQ